MPQMFANTKDDLKVVFQIVKKFGFFVDTIRYINKYYGLLQGVPRNMTVGE